MFYAKKSLGQNFLKSPGIFSKIIEASKIANTDTILEIGPGTGELTKRLLEKALRVLAVEKDTRLITPLKEKFVKEIKSGKLVLVEADILDFKPATYNLQPNSYKLVANIPYYITGAILKKFLEIGPQPSRIVLLIQKEVADRIVAKNAKESILSMSVKTYGRPRIAGIVPPGCFVPPPTVDSAILVVEKISKKIFSTNKINKTKFFEILKKGFAHKRKILSGNLSKIIPKERFSVCKIPINTRAEDLKIENWICLAKK